MGLEDLFLRWLIHIDGKFVLPFGSRFQFLPHGFSVLPGTAWVFSDVAVAFPAADPRERGWSCTVAENRPCFHSVPLVTLVNPIQCGREGQGHECQETEIPGGHLEGRTGHIVCFLSMRKNSVHVLLSSFYRWSFVSLPKTTKLSNSKQVCLTPEPVSLPLYSATSQQTSPLGT